MRLPGTCLVTVPSADNREKVWCSNFKTMKGVELRSFAHCARLLVLRIRSILPSRAQEAVARLRSIVFDLSTTAAHRVASQTILVMTVLVILKPRLGIGIYIALGLASRRPIASEGRLAVVIVGISKALLRVRSFPIWLVEQTLLTKSSIGIQ